jgi:hypothetical protein
LPGPSWTFLPFPFQSLQSEVSLTGRQTWQNEISKRKGKDIRKKRHQAAFVFVPSVFGEKFPTAEF